MKQKSNKIRHMEQKEEIKKRAYKSQATIRKAYHKADGRTQKMVSFRLDLDLAPLLSKEENKGRLINDLLRTYFEAQL